MACSTSYVLVGIGSFGARSVGAFAKEQGVWHVCGMDWGSRPDELPADAAFFDFDFDISDGQLFKPSEAQVELAVRRLANNLSRRLVHTEHPLVFFCKLGGASGSFIPPLILDILGIPPSHARAVVSTPFPWEGAFRNECASCALSAIRSRVSEVAHISPRKVMEEMDIPVPMIDAYHAVEERILDGVRSCLRDGSEKEA